MADQMVENQNKALAEEKMFESIRDLLTVKITLPLGNPNYKLIHTNSFIWCDLSGMVDLENFHIITNAMNSTFNRYVTYEENRWYVEGVTINEDQGSNKGTMELTLNPFPSTLKKYRDNMSGYRKAYEDAFNKNNQNTAVTSTGNSTLTGGEGEFIDNLVRQICGNITDPLERAKAIHNHIKSKQHYSSYPCSHYSSAEQCYKNITHLNCADMSRLTRAMMASAGLTCYVVHNNRGVGHFWVVLEINGKKYASDNASTATREFDYFWNPETESTQKAVNGGVYYYNRGKNPSC